MRTEDAMNISQQLPMSDWQIYFDRISKALLGERALVEIEDLTFGDRIQARCLPLIGITYDPKDDILEIAMEGIDHLIHHPREIVVSEGSEGLERLDVTDSTRKKQKVRLVKPLRYMRRTVPPVRVDAAPKMSAKTEVVTDIEAEARLKKAQSAFGSKE
jgi:hypothetical protein